MTPQAGLLGDLATDDAINEFACSRHFWVLLISLYSVGPLNCETVLEAIIPMFGCGNRMQLGKYL